MKKKVIIFFASLIMILGGISIGSMMTNNQTVQASSFAKRHHLKAYNIPKKYRGYWKSQRGFRIHITKRHIWGTFLDKHPRQLTYKNKSSVRFYKTDSKNRTYLCGHSGKWLWFAAPSGETTSMRRSGRHLLVRLDTWEFKCHR